MSVVRDKVCDYAAEFWARVFLEEVAGALDDGMLQPGRAGNDPLEDRRHAAGNRVTVAERDEERLGPLA
jgi:hypothetical protein